MLGYPLPARVNPRPKKIDFFVPAHFIYMYIITILVEASEYNTRPVQNHQYIPIIQSNLQT